MKPFQKVFWRDDKGFVKAESVLVVHPLDSDKGKIDYCRIIDMQIAGLIKDVYKTNKIDPMDHELEYMQRNSRIHER